MLRDCPHQQYDNQRVYNVGGSYSQQRSQECAKNLCSVENQQADHQASVVELEGIITKQPISVLIDPGSNISYISPRVVEACSLQRKKHTLKRG
jgi:hypothetical protein